MPEKIENNCANKLESYTDQNVVSLLVNNVVDHFGRSVTVSHDSHAALPVR